MTIFDHTMQLLGRTLDLRQSRQRVIASNIANEETPGYRATDLNFQDSLQAAQRGRGPVTLAVTQGLHIGPRGNLVQQVTGKLGPVPAEDMPLDSNSVNIELEMAKMSDNAMQYNSAAAIMAIRFRQLMGAIREGR
ncbi:MAG: flagellar basal body rod protein FlgB [Nitrospiraceae bacterium]|nr:flagellar basal body rod protein FlgB [Nitrospiraceae bacterium]